MSLPDSNSSKKNPHWELDFLDGNKDSAKSGAAVSAQKESNMPNEIKINPQSKDGELDGLPIIRKPKSIEEIGAARVGDNPGQFVGFTDVQASSVADVADSYDDTDHHERPSGFPDPEEFDDADSNGHAVKWLIGSIIAILVSLGAFFILTEAGFSSKISQIVADASQSTTDRNDPAVTSPPLPTTSSTSTPIPTVSSTTGSLQMRFQEQLSQLQTMLDNGDLDAAEVALGDIELAVYGYGQPEFDHLKEQIARLRNGEPALPFGSPFVDTGTIEPDSEQSTELVDSTNVVAEQEALRQAEEAAANAEAQRLAQEQEAAVQAEAAAEAQRLAQAEAEREAEAKRQREAAEAERLAQQEAAKAEAKRNEEAAEAQRLAQQAAAEAEVRRQAEESQRIAELAAVKAEAERVAAEQAEAAQKQANEAELLRRAQAEEAERAAAEQAAQQVREAQLQQRLEQARLAKQQAQRERLAEIEREKQLAAEQQAQSERLTEIEREKQLAAEQQAAASEQQQRSSDEPLAYVDKIVVNEEPSLVPNGVITDAEFENVYGNFIRLAKAIENRDIATVISLSNSKGVPVQELLQLFDNNRSIKTRIEDVSARNAENTIIGKLKIVKLIRNNGDEVLPPKKLASLTLTSKRNSAGSWSVITY